MKTILIIYFSSIIMFLVMFFLNYIIQDKDKLSNIRLNILLYIALTPVINSIIAVTSLVLLITTLIEKIFNYFEAKLLDKNFNEILKDIENE